MAESEHVDLVQVLASTLAIAEDLKDPGLADYARAHLVHAIEKATLYITSTLPADTEAE